MIRDMKFPSILACLACAGLAAAPSYSSGQPAASAATNLLGPRMTFATKVHHFGKILGGEKVKWVYVLTNTGDQPLIISNVAPGCHCTTVGDWTKAHEIEPGQRGEIPIQFDSGNFRSNITRTILVTSNDKLEPRQTLSLDCTIWRPFEVRPQSAHVNVTPDAISNEPAVVDITSQSDEPVTLSNPTSANGKFKAELKTKVPGKKFEVTISAVPPFAPGNTVGTITVNTSQSNMPVINITVSATLQPAVFVSPTQIPLSPQITRWTTNRVKINANSGKMLVLSDPRVSDTNVIVQIKETVQGREFQIAAAFPPGLRPTRRWNCPSNRIIRNSL